jgi:hypothetical protein
MSSIPSSNLNGRGFNLSAPCLPEPFYPENNQDDDLDSLWANLSGTLPSTFLPEEEFNARFLNLPAGSQTANIPLPTTNIPQDDNLNSILASIIGTLPFPSTSEPSLPEPMRIENTQEASREGLLEKFIEALSDPSQFVLEEDFKVYFWNLSRELKNQIENNPVLKSLIDKVIQTLERPNRFVFSVFFQPIRLGTDHCPLELVGIDPPMELANAAPKYFNKTLQDLLVLLLEECFHTNEGTLFELVFKIHQKLNYPKIVYKSSSNNNYIVKILKMDLVQFTLFHNRISFLQLVNLQNIPLHFTTSLTCQLIYKPHPKFTLLADKNIELLPIQQSLFYLILNKPEGLECFFKTTPPEVIEELVDYLLQSILRGYSINVEVLSKEYPFNPRKNRTYRPFQDPNIFEAFLNKIVSLSIKFNLDERERWGLALVTAANHFIAPQAIFFDQLRTPHVPSHPRMNKHLANYKDDVYISHKFQGILTEKSYSLLVQGRDLSNEDLNWIVSASVFEKDHLATVLLQLLNLKKTSLQVQKVTAGFVRQFEPSFRGELPKNAGFDTKLVLTKSSIPHEVVQWHTSFILDFFECADTILAYLHLLDASLSTSECLMVLNTTFTFEFSSAHHGTSTINSSIISLIYPILSTRWNDFYKTSGIEVSFCNQTALFVAHCYWIKAMENAQITNANAPLPPPARRQLRAFSPYPARKEQVNKN